MNARTAAGESQWNRQLDGERRVDAIETHVSRLILLGDSVYKQKRHVRYGFCDLSRREERERLCHREVELNRRFSPDVYLGVLDVSENGRLLDHLVMMRRLPRERRLDLLLRHSDSFEAPLTEVLRVLMRHDVTAERSDAVSAAATSEAIGRAWQGSFDETARYVGSVLERDVDQRIQHLARRYIDGRGPLLQERIRARRIRDGHGDLRAENIFILEDGARILDCVEFDDELRHLDLLSDICFLAMDLRASGNAKAEQWLLERYVDVSGDRFPASLADHYRAMHAYVRAMVACLRSSDDETQAVLARRLHELSLSYLQAAKVRVILVGGIPGAGKTTLARELAEATGAILLRSDVLRRELSPASDAQGERYATEVTDRTYELMLDRARIAIERGESAVLDASWAQARYRAMAARVAAETATDMVELRCELPLHLAQARIERRRRMDNDESEATAEVAEAMAEAMQPWPSAVPIDTSFSPQQALQLAQAALALSPDDDGPSTLVQHPAVEHRVSGGAER